MLLFEWIWSVGSKIGHDKIKLHTIKQVPENPRIYSYNVYLFLYKVDFTVVVAGHPTEGTEK